MIERFEFTNWADTVVVFAVDWDKLKAAEPTTSARGTPYHPIWKDYSRTELVEVLQEAAKIAVSEQVGKDLSNYGVYFELCAIYGTPFMDGTFGVVFSHIDPPDLELELTKSEIINEMPNTPKPLEW